MGPLKPLHKWTEAYLSNLPTAEFDWIDYKASDKFRSSDFSNELSKYVSAWSNYDGGYLIFGVKDPIPGVPLEIDGGVPVKSIRNLPLWLDQVVPALVDPPLRTIETHLITPKSNGSKINPDHAVIVIHVSESEDAPHQARDGKYYRRQGRLLTFVGHRALLDILNRKKHPRVTSEPSIFVDKTLFLDLRLRNVGNIMARYTKAVVLFPTRIGVARLRPNENRVQLLKDKQGKWAYEIRFFTPLQAPLFPGSDISYRQEFIVSNNVDEPTLDQLQVKIFADEMPVVTECFDIHEIADSSTLERLGARDATYAEPATLFGKRRGSSRNK